jgi:hypothetical protein
MPILKVINSILILFALFMGVKQGWAMISLKPDMLEMFSRFHLSKSAIMAMGALTIIAALLVLIPQTFLWGNFLTAALILFIIALDLSQRDLKAAAIEIPFLLVSLVILYLGHPLSRE